MNKRAAFWELFCALVGIAASVAAASTHHHLLYDPSYPSFCVVDTVSCSQVYASRFSTFQGIPVAILGVLFFAVSALLSIATLTARPLVRERVSGYLFVLSTLALAFVLYLAYTVFVQLRVLCPLCLITYAAVIGLFLVSGAANSNPTTPVPPRLAEDSRALNARPLAITIVVLSFSFVALLAALFALEGAIRLMDGYKLFSLHLRLAAPTPIPATAQLPPASAKWRHTSDAAEYVARLPIAPGVNAAWYLMSPAAQETGAADEDLAERERKYKTNQANYEWNRRGVVRALCGDEPRNLGIFNPFKDLFVFDATDGSQFPSFRFLRNAKYPSGLRTNNFGFRGRDIPLNKPRNTIRIGFVGASTTIARHTEPYSYPDLVGSWLNVWAQSRHLPLTFEIMNTAREGTDSRTFQAVVRQELVPLEPDLVVYYEGANQFWPVAFIREQLPPRSRISGPQSGVLASYSAVARRIENITSIATRRGSESSKPPLTVDWPAGLSETAPDLNDPRLPESLRGILGDLDTIRGALQDDGGHLVMSSFSWLVYQGLKLDLRRDSDIHKYLNNTYWPFSYAHLRRFADFQNRVFQVFARDHGLDFIDFAAVYPLDPRLFEDAIHMTTAGIRLQAWIMFNGLLPAVERRVEAHELPRDDRHALTVHPAFATGRQLVDVDTLRASCGAPH